MPLHSPWPVPSSLRSRVATVAGGTKFAATISLPASLPRLYSVPPVGAGDQAGEGIGVAHVIDMRKISRTTLAAR
jgi:hypothetical protein